MEILSRINYERLFKFINIYRKAKNLSIQSYTDIDILATITGRSKDTINNWFTLDKDGNRKISNIALRRLKNEIIDCIENSLPENESSKNEAASRIKELEKFCFDVSGIPFESKQFSYSEPSTFLEKFADSKWYCYERKPDCISRKIIRFKEISNDEINVTIELPNEKGVFVKPFIGIAKILNTRYLIITANGGGDNPTRGYTHMMLRLPELNQEFDTCVGHMTYEHPRFSQILTKTVVLNIIDDKTSGSISAIDFTDKNKTTEIPIEIRYFLREKHRNRLSSPKNDPIFNLQTLREWAGRNISNKLSPKLLQSLIGNYSLFFNSNPADIKTLHKDEFSLKIDEYSRELMLEYKHKSNNRLPQSWSGAANINYSKKIVAFYSGYEGERIYDKRDTDNFDNPIFIVFSIPPAERSTINLLVGTIAGVRDEELGSVARLFVAIKKEDIKEFDKTILEKFFQSYIGRSWVRPPAQIRNPISTFDELKNSIREGITTQEKIIKLISGSVKTKPPVAAKRKVPKKK